jgi:hypothetical protein
MKLGQRTLLTAAKTESIHLRKVLVDSKLASATETTQLENAVPSLKNQLTLMNAEAKELIQKGDTSFGDIVES